VNLNQNENIADFFDLLAWFRGDQRIGTIPVNNIGASGTVVLLIEPPNADEEWEILAIAIKDANHIDIADQVEFSLVDEVTSTFFDLQQSTLSAHLRDAGFIVTFPNRDTTANQARFDVAALYNGLVLRKKDSTTSWIRIRALYAATATVGTRSIVTSFIYKRRPVS